jgi:hypothetical protein
LARELDFVCDARTFYFQALENACTNFLEHSQKCCAEVNDLCSPKDIAKWFSASALRVLHLASFRRRRILPLDLLELSMSHRSRQATVLHDKISGFLDLSAPEARKYFIVDYKKPLQQCYIENTVGLIKSSKTFNVFNYLWNPIPHLVNPNNKTKRLPGLPS